MRSLAVMFLLCNAGLFLHTRLAASTSHTGTRSGSRTGVAVIHDREEKLASQDHWLDSCQP
jgi:hypothetical protein